MEFYNTIHFKLLLFGFGDGNSIKVAKYKVTINLHNMIHKCSLFERGPTYVMYGRCSVVVGINIKY